MLIFLYTEKIRGFQSSPMDNICFIEEEHMTDFPAPKFLKILQCLRDIHPEFPLAYAIVVAEVSLAPGTSQIALAEKVPCSPSTLSRILSNLSKSDGPYKLLKITPHPTSRREHCVHLTAAGQKLIEKLDARIRS